MKSENDLRITGIIVSAAPPKPGSKSIRFQIAHNFGGRQDPLFLDCLLNLGPETEIPKKGMHVRMRSYLRVRGGRIEAVAKTIESTPSEE